MMKVDLEDIEIRYEFALKFLNGFCPPDESFIDEKDMSLKIMFDTGQGESARVTIIYPKHCWRWRQASAN